MDVEEVKNKLEMGDCLLVVKEGNQIKLYLYITFQKWSPTQCALQEK
jgi:hypothetical protein